MKKTKTKIAVKRSIFKIVLILILVAVIGIATKNEAQNAKISTGKRQEVQSIIQTAYAATTTATEVALPPVEEPTDMKQWVKWKIEQNGLKWKDVECLVNKESRWDDMAIYDNPNGAGVDRGLFMFSSIWHKEISNKEAFDYKKATEYFIKIVKKDKNYHQWWGYVNFCK